MKDFSQRVLTHPKVIWEPGANGRGIVVAVRDQLLVTSGPPSDAVKAKLTGQGFTVTKITSLRHTGPPGPLDVDVLKLTRSPGWNIFNVTRTLRTALTPPLGQFDPRDISPNHILIPAVTKRPADSHSCPYGPPRKAKPRVLRPQGGSGPRVTVIDSGYQWDPNWSDHNPLEQGRTVNYVQGAHPGQPTGWVADQKDVPSVFADGVLDGLAGHGNFVVGLVLQRCPSARITIVNHNGGLDPTRDDLPTEAAIAHSLLHSAGADVITVGFAFEVNGPISKIWDAAFTAVGGVPVLSPAGNRSTNRRHYPAALNTTYRGLFPNMMAVASVLDRPSPSKGQPLTFTRSDFSNHGIWVTCSAIGSNVRSTFLHVNLPVQDDPNNQRANRDFASTNWATWNGTCFATPKVAGEIANLIVPGPLGAVTAAVAWPLLQGTQGTRDPTGQLGTMFNF